MGFGPRKGKTDAGARPYGGENAAITFTNLDCDLTIGQSPYGTLRHRHASRVAPPLLKSVATGKETHCLVRRQRRSSLQLIMNV